MPASIARNSIAHCTNAREKQAEKLSFDRVRIIFTNAAQPEKVLKKEYCVLDLPAGTVTASFDTLNLRERKLTSLAGLEEIPSLKVLYAQDNYLTSLRHIHQNTLETLHVERNRISDFVGCHRLPKLRSVHLEGNPVENMELFEIMCCLSLNPDMHKVNGRIVSRLERELISLLDRPTLTIALQQGWILSATGSEDAVVDLPVDEFFFRLDPAFEQHKQQKESITTFDIHLNLKKSYERLAGMPLLISPQLSRTSATNPIEYLKEKKSDGDFSKSAAVVKPKWSIAGVQSHQRETFVLEGKPDAECLTSLASHLKCPIGEHDPTSEKFNIAVKTSRKSLNNKANGMQSHKRNNHTKNEKPYNNFGTSDSDLTSVSGDDASKTSTNRQGTPCQNGHYCEAYQTASSGVNVLASSLDTPFHVQPELLRNDLDSESKNECEEVLNWKLSSMDFQSPLKIQSLLHSDVLPSISNNEKENGIMHEATNMSPFKSENNVHFNNVSTNTSLQNGIYAVVEHENNPKNPSTTVEFSVPITQYLYVPSLSSHAFPELNTLFKVDVHQSTDLLVSYRPHAKNLAETLNRYICETLFHDWRRLASQRRSLREGLTSDLFNFRHIPIIGAKRRLQALFQIWILNLCWTKCCIRIWRHHNQYLLAAVFQDWKHITSVSMLQEHFLQEMSLQNRIIKAVHSCRFSAKFDASQSYASLLRASKYRLLTLKKNSKNDHCSIRPFCFWKDAVRDSKLEQLHSRIWQIEDWIVMARQNAESRRRPPKSDKAHEWDSKCLESLVDEMLNSMDRAQDDELKSRMVLLLQVVANVNANDQHE